MIILWLPPDLRVKQECRLGRYRSAELRGAWLADGCRRRTGLAKLGGCSWLFKAAAVTFEIDASVSRSIPNVPPPSRMWPEHCARIPRHSASAFLIAITRSNHRGHLAGPTVSSSRSRHQTRKLLSWPNPMTVFIRSKRHCRDQSSGQSKTGVLISLAPAERTSRDTTPSTQLSDAALRSSLFSDAVQIGWQLRWR